MDAPIKEEFFWAVGRSTLVLEDGTEESRIALTVNGKVLHLSASHAQIMAACLLQCTGAACSVVVATEKEASHG